ncbi:MAG: S-layer homology domain-containing protein [Proteobacteria bacterium]|nr:S-layer homology domain-containing protein [Pseudomonadota bacterium]
MVLNKIALAAAAVISTAPAMAQVTSVTQLRDVQPTEWSYQAISNLITNYGCIAGYPSGVFKPGQAATRAELAALTNACLDNITQFYTEADARTAAALRAEFSREIAATNSRVSALELAAARKSQGVGNYLGAAVLLNQQGVEGNGYDATRTIAGATIQGRYAVKTFANQNAVSVRPYVNFVGDPTGQIGAGGGTLLTYDWSLARASSGVSRLNLYTGVGYQVPFVNNTLSNFQSAVGEKGQAVFAVGAESRLTSTLTAFADVKFPTTNAANSYGVEDGSYSPVYSLGLGFKF